jgi:ABC-2 type transport system ATP-binding protein
VEVEDGSDALAARLTTAGLEAIADGRVVLIAVADDRPYDIVRDMIVELGLPLVRIEQRRHRLEDLFRDGPGDARDVVSANEGAPAAPDEARS